MNTDITEKLSKLRAQAKAKFLERNAEVDGILCALLARHHVLLLGPPGEAKSALAEVITESIDGADLFKLLLTKTTTPEEICGPLDLPALEQGRYRRKTTGYLPEAHIAYVDEVFKGSSAILNTMLTALNERAFDNDGGRHGIPLTTAVGASNELPDDRELGALYDRFLLRFWVSPVKSRNARRTLLQRNGTPLSIQQKLTLPELESAISEVEHVTMEDSIVDRLLDIRENLEDLNITASDRRWIQAVRVLKARAYLHGRDHVRSEDLVVLADVLWREPKERADIARLISTIAHPVTAEALEALDAAQAEVLKMPAYTGSNAQEVIDATRTTIKKLRKVKDDLGGIAAGATDSERGEVAEVQGRVDEMISEVKGKADRLLEV